METIELIFDTILIDPIKEELGASDTQMGS